MIVWLVSYPRSGNTLTRSVFKHYFDLSSLSVYGDKSDIASNSQFSQLVGHQKGDINTVDLDALRASSAPTLIKTHDGPNSSMSSEDTYIHIIRDGRDSVLSYYYYLRDIVGQTEVTLSDVISGQVTFGLWGHHTARWCQVDQSKVLRFQFEDIVKDKSGFAHEVSEIIGQSPNSEPFPGLEKFKEAAPTFVRSGKVGGWQNEFSDLQVSLFDLYNDTAMRMAGYRGKKPTGAEVKTYMTFANHLETARLDFANARQELDHTRQELDHTRQELDHARQEVNKAQVEVSELGIRFTYLEDKARKRIRRINKAKSVFGIRPHKLPWDHE